MTSPHLAKDEESTDMSTINLDQDIPSLPTIPPSTTDAIHLPPPAISTPALPQGDSAITVANVNTTSHPVAPSPAPSFPDISPSMPLPSMSLPSMPLPNPDFSYPSIEIDDHQSLVLDPIPEPAIPQTPPESGLNGFAPYHSFSMHPYNDYAAQLEAHRLSAYATALNIGQDPQPDQIAAYAKLEFDDGTYYMKTLNLILGRDVEAFNIATRLEKLMQKEQKEMAQEAQEAAQNDNNDDTNPQSAIKPTKKRTNRYTPSVMSYGAGFVRNFPKDELVRRKSRKSRKSRRSMSFGEADLSRRNSALDVYAHNHQSYVPDSQAPRPVTDETDINAETFLAIHPHNTHDITSFKRISRRHAKISYNHHADRFDLDAMAVVWHNGHQMNKGDTRPLEDGDSIQIYDLMFRFLLPLNNEDDTCATTEIGKQISFEFETGSRDAKLFEDSEDSELERRASASDHDDDAALSEAESVRAEPKPAKTPKIIKIPKVKIAKEKPKEKARKPSKTPKMKSTILVDGVEVPVKSKTQPKEPKAIDLTQQPDASITTPEVIAVDGTSSDPSRSALPSVPEVNVVKKEDSHEVSTLPETHTLPDGTVVPVPERRGPGRPPKNGVMSKRQEKELQRELQEAKAGGGPIEPSLLLSKRKYTKRKPKDPNDPNQEGSPEDGPKEKKEKKERPARSPSPVFIESELTPEQLQKPTANYVQLIHDALSDPERPMMSLPQIYRAIIRRYPYFGIKVSTNGWQSSVRHNLSQHAAFEKVERDGKGWMWAIVPGSSIEKEKKRKTPPPQLGPGQPYPPYYGAPPPGYPPYMAYPQQNGRPAPPYAPYTIPGPGHMPLPALPPAPPPPTGTGYSSPYASKPPPQPTTQPSNLGQRPPLGPGQPGATGMTPQRPPGPRPQVSERVINAVESFKVHFLKSSKASGTSEAEQEERERTIQSAIDRALGYKPSPATPASAQEEQILVTLRNLINNIENPMPQMSNGQPLKRPAGPATPGAPPNNTQQPYGARVNSLQGQQATQANGGSAPASTVAPSGQQQTPGSSPAVGSAIPRPGSATTAQTVNTTGVQSVVKAITQTNGAAGSPQVNSSTAHQTPSQMSPAALAATGRPPNGTSATPGQSGLLSTTQQGVAGTKPTPSPVLSSTLAGATARPVGTISTHTPPSAVTSLANGLKLGATGTSLSAMQLSASAANHVWPPRPTAAAFEVNHSVTNNKHNNNAKTTPAISSNMSLPRSNSADKGEKADKVVPPLHVKRPLDIGITSKVEEPPLKKLNQGTTS